jgi:hypothetical protein
MRQLTKKMVRVMKRARVDRATVTAKETRVTATTVVAMMANGAKDIARPHNYQLRGSANYNSKGNKNGKGVGDSGYGDNVNKRDHGGGDDGKWQ